MATGNGPSGAPGEDTEPAREAGDTSGSGYSISNLPHFLSCSGGRGEGREERGREIVTFFACSKGLVRCVSCGYMSAYVRESVCVLLSW